MSSIEFEIEEQFATRNKFACNILLSSTFTFSQLATPVQKVVTPPQSRFVTPPQKVTTPLQKVAISNKKGVPS